MIGPWKISIQYARKQVSILITIMAVMIINGFILSMDMGNHV